MSNKLKCLIVDDEPIALQIVEDYCMHLADIEVIACCQNAFEAKEIIENQKIDLLFLDINLPVLDGVAFLKTLKNPPFVIFTTAYREFAIEAFDLSAVDYLLKPFSLERFIVAIDKVKEKINPILMPNKKPLADDTEMFTFIKYEGKIHKVDFDNLLYVEAKGNNIQIVSTKALISPAMTFTAFLEHLPVSKFIRLHRSFVINKTKISHIEGNIVKIENHEIPIGASYRDDFLKELGL
jgi:DNA-binding LytR/AlgR family response regulator